MTIWEWKTAIFRRNDGRHLVGEIAAGLASGDLWRIKGRDILNNPAPQHKKQDARIW